MLRPKSSLESSASLARRGCVMGRLCSEGLYLVDRNAGATFDGLDDCMYRMLFMPELHLSW